MLLGKCLQAHLTAPATRSKACNQRCCALLSSSGHQQPQVAQAAARTSAPSEACQSGIVAPVAGRLSGLYQLLPHPDVSPQAFLNEKLKYSSSWEELSALLDANFGILDIVNISTAWTRLAVLYGSRVDTYEWESAALGRPPVQEPAFREFMAHLIDVTAQRLRLFGVRALANVVWAMSNADWKLEQHEPAVGELLHEWCAVIHDRLDQLRLPDVSHIAMAIGRLDNRWPPDFLANFYRSVLHRDDLLAQLDVSTLNNLLFGLSRARRKGLVHVGPSTYKRLADCVQRLLQRAAGQQQQQQQQQAMQLTPCRAANLLYNCHKLSLRIGAESYQLLMPLVAQLYIQVPCPMDLWTFSFLTGFVDAHRRVKPQYRPDLQPLYAYVERRMPEATASQLAMLSHVFSELRCPPPAPFWGHVFGRYLSVSQRPARPSQQSQSAHRHAQQQQQQQQLAGVEEQRAQSPHAQRTAQPAAQHQPRISRVQGVLQPPPPLSQQQQQQQSGGPLQSHAQAQAPWHPAHHHHNGNGANSNQQQLHPPLQGPVVNGQGCAAAQSSPGSGQAGPGMSLVQPAPLSSEFPWPYYAPANRQPPPLAHGQAPAQHGPAPAQHGPAPSRQQLHLPPRQLQQQQLQQQQPPLQRQLPGHTVRPPEDDLLDPRTLHYVCWQAAKAGVLPPRTFLQLYLHRVPQWLVRHAADREVAQAVETLRLLRWVPPTYVREQVCSALERRLPTSTLPLRKLLRWLQKQH